MFEQHIYEKKDILPHGIQHVDYQVLLNRFAFLFLLREHLKKESKEK